MKISSLTWKTLTDDKSEEGQQKINTVISSLMLRRTKEQLQLEGSLSERNFELIEIKFKNAEEKVYNEVLMFSRSLLKKFFKQTEEKSGGHFTLPVSKDDQAEYDKMYETIFKQNNAQPVKPVQILAVLFRLKQICVHPHLILKKLESTDDFDLSRNLNLLELVGLTEAGRELLNPSNPIFAENYTSSKFKAALKLLEEKILPTNDKAIIVSEWTTVLKLFGKHLKNNNIKFDVLDRSIEFKKRSEIIQKINNDDTRVLLLSLTIILGDLHLVGANHLLLLDWHWNPHRELQVQDRMCTVGQKKEVHVYKFMIADTIEEKIKINQGKKLELAAAVEAAANTNATYMPSMEEMKELLEI